MVCGPTASGKTALAASCAKLLNTEVISADSQMVYRGLNIGTAKPTAEETLGVPHSMIDVADAKQNFSVGDYKELALPRLNNILNGGKIPVICGGTGFYINSLLFDFGYGNAPKCDDVRKKYEEFLKDYGKEALFEKLKQCDKESAEKLHVNDTKRVIRALEIFEVSGKRKSDQNDSLTPRFNYLAVAINWEREALYKRIDERVDRMFDAGLVEEVKHLLQSGIDENCQCMQAIGYKEIVFGLKNGLLESTMRDIIKQNTRHYAKRQITFFKKLPNLIWLDAQSATAENVLEMLNVR